MIKSIGISFQQFIDLLYINPCEKDKRTKHFGGKERTFEKYAYLGGPIAEWAKKAYRTNQPMLAVKILADGWQMLVASALKKQSYAINERPW